MLPNYIHAGQPKAGSTSLHFMLANHPDVSLVQSKEAHFFDVDENYAKGLEFYERNFFSHSDGEKIVGDITPAYFKENALERIARDLGDDTKITVCFRFPVARLCSHYYHDVRLLTQPDSLYDALSRSSLYIEPSLGGRLLNRLYELFPSQNVLPLVFERDFSAGAERSTYERICAFLNIEPLEQNEIEKRSAGFLPHISVAKNDGTVRDYRGARSYGRGDVIIETLQWTTHYIADVIPGSDGDKCKRYLSYFDNTTMALDNVAVREIFDLHFKEDVNLLKELLGDDLPEWDLAGKHIRAPARLESRIIQSSDSIMGKLGSFLSRFK